MDYDALPDSETSRSSPAVLPMAGAFLSTGEFKFEPLKQLTP